MGPDTRPDAPHHAKVMRMSHSQEKKNIKTTQM
mgnify:CR=1 FL=1